MPEMSEEDFANFTGGLQDATDGLGDFTDALGDASGAGLDVGGMSEGEMETLLAGETAGERGAGKAGPGNALQSIASSIIGIASSGLPPGVGTILTTAVGSKL